MTITLSDEGRTMIRDSGGTSASAPIWAALIALADQYATAGSNTMQFPPKTITTP